ncbi:MAG: TetR/AcrR family transcriptional regulator [Cycloclasticus sp.]|nr:TetR/AcrR family transcriptional regulator [Cycloclasticus sp.]
MARTREFDEQKALKKAMTLFRRQGYKATSLAALLKTMGLSRSSFYETFGSKRELFLSTLELFGKTGAIYNFVDSNSAEPAKLMFAQIFARVVASAIEGQGGCMFGNCAIEFATSDKEVSDQISQGLSELESLFIALIEAGQAKGDVAKDKDVKAIAAHLMATFYGIQTMAKAGVELSTLKPVIAQTLRQLD